MRRLAATLAAILGVAALGGCRNGSPDRGEAVLTDGRAEIARGAGSSWRTVTGGSINRGERVRVREGTAVLRLTSGGHVEMRAGSLLRLERTPVLEEGHLLVLPSGSPVVIDAGPVTAAVRGGPARLARTLAFEAGSYAGDVEIRSADRSLTVPALRQLSVAAPGLLPDKPSPLVLRTPEDPWDRRFLGEWIDLGRDLESRSRGLTGQLPEGSATTVSFYRLLLPALEQEPAFPPLLDRSRPTGETVVGATIALESRKGPFADRWANVFSFRDQGAAWGLVALDQEVRPGPVTHGLELALGRFVDVGRVAALPPRRPAPPPRTTTRAPATTPSTSSARTRTTATTVPPPPGGAASPPPATGVSPIDDVGTPLSETLVGLLKGVVDLLGLAGSAARL